MDRGGEQLHVASIKDVHNVQLLQSTHRNA